MRRLWRWLRQRLRPVPVPEPAVDWLLDNPLPLPTFETPWGRGTPLSHAQLSEWAESLRGVSPADFCATWMYNGVAPDVAAERTREAGFV